MICLNRINNRWTLRYTVQFSSPAAYVFERPVEDLVGEIVALPGAPRGKVSHVLEDGVEGVHRLLRQLLLLQELLEERLLDGLARVLPKGVAGGAPRRRQADGAGHGALRGRPGGGG